MRQLCFDYESDDFKPTEVFSPKWLANSFVSIQDLSAKERTLLAYLRESEFFRTKRELTQALYPLVFDPRRHKLCGLCHDGYEYYDPSKEREKQYIRKTGSLIRRIDARTRNSLREITNPEERLSFLRNAQMIIRVGENSDGSALYAYHSSDRPQSFESLQNYLEWATMHGDRQSQHIWMATQALQAYYESEGHSIQYDQMQITTDFSTPDDEMDAFFKSEDYDVENGH